MKMLRIIQSVIGLSMFSGAALAQEALLPGVVVQNLPGGGESYSLTLQILALMTFLTLIPAVLLMTTSFARIIIVLSILRQALGTMQTPPNQVLIGLALFLTFYVMSPIFERINDQALQPYLQEEIKAEVAIERAVVPMREFMLAQTRETDIELFANIAGIQVLENKDELPLRLLVPAFITSELKTAFQIGFMIFIPFVVIDLVVASVLMSMGMMMLSPMMISLPFKLMLFVLVDGWSLTLGTLASSFYPTT
jgi:flagellar biosynthetic protein FliP